MPTHLENYLAYYKTCEDPGYAVLVTGDWGTGKTFQVKKALSESERYYVSLFGLKTSEEIYAAVFAEMFPIKASVRNAATAAEGVSFGFPLVANFGAGKLIPSIANALIKKQVVNNRTLIFDDLERCELSLKEKLGILNSYVEHYGCRVVVIAHDGKLEEDFKEAKEKVFGQTIRVEPQTDSAFAKFLDSLADKGACGFVKKYQQEILAAFNASQVKSLRVLRHVINDLARLYKELDVLHLKHDEAMKELVGLFIALNIEVREGNLVESDLLERRRAQIVYQMRNQAKTKEKEAKMPAFVESAKRYSSIDLSNMLLNDSLIVDMFINGRFDQRCIRESLNSNPHFMKPSESPAWKVFIQFNGMDDEDAEAAMQKLNEQFDRREIFNPGEMLHLFALRFMMAENRLLTRKLILIQGDCKKYIDDMLKSGKLPPRELTYNWHDSFDGGYGGFAYWVTKASEPLFVDVLSYLLRAMEQALETEFPKLIPELLNILEKDGEAFYGQICFSNGRPNTYAAVPILKAIAPSEFVDVWMRSHPKNWLQIRYALQERYSGRRLAEEMKEEASWLRTVLKLLEAESSKARGIRKLRINRIIPTDLKARLDEFDKSIKHAKK